MFSFETILQDRKSHIPGSAEARLNDEINALEVKKKKKKKKKRKKNYFLIIIIIIIYQ